VATIHNFSFSPILLQWQPSTRGKSLIWLRGQRGQSMFSRILLWTRWSPRGCKLLHTIEPQVWYPLALSWILDITSFFTSPFAWPVIEFCTMIIMQISQYGVWEPHLCKKKLGVITHDQQATAVLVVVWWPQRTSV
jgi:hypothetical protein